MHIFSSWGYLHSHLSPKSEYTIVSQTLGTEQPSQYFTLRQCGGISYLRQSSFQMQSRPAHPLQMGTLSWAEVENCDLSLGKLVSSRTWAQVNNVKWPQSKLRQESRQTYILFLGPILEQAGRMRGERGLHVLFIPSLPPKWTLRSQEWQISATAVVYSPKQKWKIPGLYCLELSVWNFP